MDNQDQSNHMTSGGLVMVIHGPEIIDSGDAALLVNILQPTRIIISGVMARTAAEESGLPVEFSGSPPSMTMKNLDQRCFLANQGKTSLSGQVFGEIVASRLEQRGLVQLESAERCIYLWNGGDEMLAKELSELTGFILVSMSGERNRIDEGGDRTDEMRKIRGCIPGEAVFVNGIVIGTATEETVTIASIDGHIVPMSGLIPKAHGLEKVGPVRIRTAWCKSGTIRSVSPSITRQMRRVGRILVVDHCAHEIYQRIGSDICGILSIGDDTTAVCAHIGAHLGIPVFGVVDGDIDLVVPCGHAPGSVIIETVRERDDDIGREIASQIPDGEVSWDTWVKETLEILGERVRVKGLPGDPGTYRE